MADVEECCDTCEYGEELLIHTWVGGVYNPLYKMVCTRYPLKSRTTCFEHCGEYKKRTGKP